MKAAAAVVGPAARWGTDAGGRVRCRARGRLGLGFYGRAGGSRGAHGHQGRAESRRSTRLAAARARMGIVGPASGLGSGQSDGLSLGGLVGLERGG
jgi:hypothetical protein